MAHPLDYVYYVVNENPMEGKFGWRPRYKPLLGDGWLAIFSSLDFYFE